ncbi:SREBP regulating gene protein-like [Clavelina lepadiformis]|uniref:SREBP regulating gene protein n=1 Tax=Clavelina lepadiformis TaxID=159417 RepID=A0ABP0F7F7_CLALP
MAVLGSLRKRWVLGAIFCTSLIYFVYNTIGFRVLKDVSSKESHLLKIARSREKLEGVLRRLKWQPSVSIDENDVEKSEQFPHILCRNSLQGKEIIVDDKGFVCDRTSLKPSGCCDTFHSSRYVCESCLHNNCCSVYEHCVSCCLEPDNRSLLEKIILETSNNLQQMILSTIDDQFDLCLSRCRTSSLSVQHENVYRDPSVKFCFGRNIPDLKIV